MLRYLLLKVSSSFDLVFIDGFASASIGIGASGCGSGVVGSARMFFADISPYYFFFSHCKTSMQQQSAQNADNERISERK
jgi:hypothetical protein